MQQDNNIENKLRELEDEQLPDLSNMDAHWQQMAAMLQPVAAPVKPGWPKWMMNTLSVVAVAVMIGSAMWYLSSQKQPGNTVAVQTANSPQIEKETAAIAVSDTSGSETVNAVSTVAPVQSQQQTNEVTDFTADAGASIFDSLKINFTDCNTCPSKQTGNIVETSAERKMMLQQFFGQLEKPAQHFIIDNNRDTLLQFEEGTALLIPAQSFGGMNGVEITAKEFYKRSDIILNQLHTASNKEQLITGGMLQLNASYKNMAVQVDKEKPLLLFMPDTSNRMEAMQLFYGEEAKESTDTGNGRAEVLPAGISKGKPVNWISQPQRFSRRNSITQVKVLNLVNMPYQVKEKNGKRTAFFLVGENGNLSKDAIKKALKEKYGYDKIRLRNAEWWEVHDRTITWTDTSTGYFSSFYASKIGDSMWMEKEVADKYKLAATAVRTVPAADYRMPISFRGDRSEARNLPKQLDTLSAAVAQSLQNRYAVNISQLGWINSDRFYSDSRKKVDLIADLGDAAGNYYTMLIFDHLNSMMTGTVNGSKVKFQNLPAGEPVKVISIGINKKGETIYSVTSATTGMEELTGIHFESTSAPGLKTALSKMDQ